MPSITAAAFVRIPLTRRFIAFPVQLRKQRNRICSLAPGVRVQEF
jgi:hypothetical protein